MHDSNSELCEINDYKVDFNHDDSDTFDIPTNVYSIGNIKQDRKFTDFYSENVLFIVHNINRDCYKILE